MSHRPRNHPRLARRGVTLLEMLVAIAIMGILTAIAVPSARAVADRAAARSAIVDLSSIFGRARREAVTRRTRVAVLLDTARGTVDVGWAGGARLGSRALSDRYGVRLEATRDSMAFDPRGLGVGAANLTVVVRRGSAAETLVVSRLGRIRR